MPDAVSELKRRAAQDQIEFFFAMFVDMHGKPCAKLVPVPAFETLMRDGVGFAGFAAGPLGQSPADPDMMAIPDPASYTAVPWQPGLAVLQCDLHVEGAPWPYAPRVILKRQLERLADRGLVLNCGVELEYFLVKREEDGGIVVADAEDRAAQPCYDAKGLTRMYDHLTVVSRYLNQIGWGNYANDHEDANGQFEQNFHYADALTTADRAIFFRYMVHTLAQQAGFSATFMPKPFSHLTGNGMHVHTSLWDASGETPLFLDEADGRGLGLSAMAYQFIGGLLEHARGAAALLAPTVNSYKRMGVGTPSSGATWAPAYATYGGNNRTQMLRVPEAGRVEHRGVDGSANPYLAFTALLAAGLDGIDRELDPGEPNRENLFELSPDAIGPRGIGTLPATLAEATGDLVEDGVLREAFGRAPAGSETIDYVDYYAQVKRDEFAAYHSVISAWEVDRYLTLF